MAKKRGRPKVPKRKVKAESLEFRLTESEKTAFQDAAESSGLSLSSWARERLRRAARTELAEIGKPVSFMDNAATRRLEPEQG